MRLNGKMEQLEYITGTAAAKMLGMSKPTLIKEAVEGHINAHMRRGRYLFTMEDIEEYVQRNMTRWRPAHERLIGCSPVNTVFKMPGGYIASSVAAKMLGMTKPTIIREALDGRLNAHMRRGRYLFTREDVLEYTQRNMTSRRHADWASKL
ncbi:MAG: helix-turn-helix domain-containing protein [Candidatus Kuenenia sp.]|nr:helix-turn-helix domain-containing protein [Candidatus Kuenenia sp.]